MALPLSHLKRKAGQTCVTCNAAWVRSPNFQNTLRLPQPVPLTEQPSRSSLSPPNLLTLHAPVYSANGGRRVLAGSRSREGRSTGLPPPARSLRGTGASKAGRGLSPHREAKTRPRKPDTGRWQPLHLRGKRRRRRPRAARQLGRQVAPAHSRHAAAIGAAPPRRAAGGRTDAQRPEEGRHRELTAGNAPRAHRGTCIQVSAAYPAV